MDDGHDLLKALAIVLGAAAVTSILCRITRQPVVLGYVIAGLVIGPHLPVPLVAEPALVHTLSELGVVLLMFSLGLEFSLRKLFRVGPSVAITAVVQCSLLMWLGFATGRLLGWTTLESLFTGAVISISSTTIIAKVFEEQGITGKLRDLVVGVLIVEDLIAVILIAILTAIATGTGLSPQALVRTTARLGGFLAALITVGLLLVPRLMRRVVKIGRPEGIVVASVAVCFGVSLLARELGYSVALGAFIAGSLVAESGEEKTVEHLVQPVRDVFAAVFFVSVGMMMDPALMAPHWVAIVALTVVVVVGKIVSVALGAFLTGHGARTSIQTGMSLAQIGEFSFIIAGVGLSLGATGDFLYPVAVSVSAITTLLTPWLIRASAPAATWMDRKLPRPLQTFVALYGSWLERLRSSGPKSEAAGQARRLVRRLFVDAAALAGLIIAGALGASGARRYLVDRAGISPGIADIATVIVLAALAAPFCIGIVRVGRKLGMVLAETALPPVPTGQPDLALAPRRALIVTLQLVILLLVGVPLVAITQPFLPGFHGAELLFAILVLLGFAAWRTARNLHGHVRAGAQVIVEALARQGRVSNVIAVELPPPLAGVLHGLGEPVGIDLVPGSPAVGKTLSQLNLRGLTGATVLAITRSEESILTPGADERLQAGDVLAIAGTREAITAARAVLVGE